MNLLFNKKTILLCRIILGCIFIYASYDKILSPEEFSKLIENYHITPPSLNNFFALIVPWVEFVVGVCLLFGVFLDGAALLSMVLLIWFIFILSQALIRGINLECGCFNSLDLIEKNKDINLKSEMIKRIIEDVVFLFMSLLVKFRRFK